MTETTTTRSFPEAPDTRQHPIPAALPACNAATYLPRDQSCWLKQTVPAATARPGVTSFVKVKGDAQATLAEHPPVAPTTKKSSGFGMAAALAGCLCVLAFCKKQ